MKDDTKQQRHLPICPHCMEDIQEIRVYVLPLDESVPFSGAHFGKRDRCIVTACPSCGVVIGTYDYYEE